MVPFSPLLSTEAKSRSIMPNRRNHRKDVEKAIKEALMREPDSIDLVLLDEEEDPEKLLILTRQYHEWLCNQSRVTDVTIRFHQGRACYLRRRLQKQEMPLSKFEKDIADRTYALFLRYEWILSRFYGKTIDIIKLTYVEIAQIRQAIENEITTLLTGLED